MNPTTETSSLQAPVLGMAFLISLMNSFGQAMAQAPPAIVRTMPPAALRSVDLFPNAEIPKTNTAGPQGSYKSLVCISITEAIYLPSIPA